MGARKRLRAEQLKENKKSIAIAHLNNSGISPRKMRLVADLIRGVEVNKALNILQFNGKVASTSSLTTFQARLTCVGRVKMVFEVVMRGKNGDRIFEFNRLV